MEMLVDNFGQDRYIAKAVCLQITLVGIKNMLVQAVPFLHARNTILNILLFLIVGVMYLNAFLRMNKTITKRVFLVFCFIVMSFAMTAVLFPKNTPYIILELPRMLPYCFLTCFLISEMKDVGWIEYYMRKLTIIILFFSVISAVFIFRIGHITSSEWSTYSMPLSYVTMIPVMWLLHLYFEEENIKWLIGASIGMIVILAYGSRNPLLGIVTYIAVSVIRKVASNRTTHKLKYIFLAFIGCIILLFWRDLLMLIGQLLSSINVSSRSISLLTKSTVDSSGRDVIHNLLWTALNTHPFMGFGVLGDEVVLGEINQSAHGLYLSILSNYGYIVGTIILLIVFYWNYRALRISKNYSKELLIIYMCMVWPRGFTGGDVWTSDVFWWMIGIIMSILSARNLEGVAYGESITCD